MVSLITTYDEIGIFIYMYIYAVAPTHEHELMTQFMIRTSSNYFIKNKINIIKISIGPLLIHRIWEFLNFTTIQETNISPLFLVSSVTNVDDNKIIIYLYFSILFLYIFSLMHVSSPTVYCIETKNCTLILQTSLTQGFLCIRQNT